MENLLGSTVVGLTNVTVETSSGGSHNNTTVVLFAHVGPSSLGAFVSTAQVNFVNKIPIVVSHFQEANITQDATNNVY